METISNEEKAIEFATSYDGKIISFAHLAALQMGQWKDEQHAQEKQQWIEKAVDFISKRFYIGINNHITSKENYYSLTELIRDFEQTMKG